MASCSRNDVVLVLYPFADLTGAKIRPAIVVSSPHPSEDVFLVPLTSRTSALLPGEFLLSDWALAGLNVPTAVKRGLYSVHRSLIAKAVGRLVANDSQRVDDSLRQWLGI
jgi:mRNA interferase MazF